MAAAEELTPQHLRTGNSLALVLDKPLLQQLGIAEETELEISTNGDVLVVTPVRDRARQRKIKKILAELDREYGGVFRRLAESWIRCFSISRKSSPSMRTASASTAAPRL